MKSNLALVIGYSGTSQTHDYAIDSLLRGMGRFDSVAAPALIDWSVLHPSQQEFRQARYTQAARLLDDWLAEPGDYDEKVGAILDEELREKLKFGSDDE